jgi:hypothetical protein
VELWKHRVPNAEAAVSLFCISDMDQTGSVLKNLFKFEIMP